MGNKKAGAEAGLFRSWWTNRSVRRPGHGIST